MTAYDLAKLRGLQRVNTMLRDQKQGRMNQLMARRVALQTQLHDLDDALRVRADNTDLDTARQAGADLLWNRWIDTRKIAINSELARLEHDIAVAKSELALALGRANVADALTDRSIAQLRKAQAKT